jgi:hypothetical protein
MGALLQSDTQLNRQSYYEASLSRPAPLAPLAGEVEIDVVVVGAGFAGLSAAIELAQRGFKVAVLEADRVCSGASGRNGGQVIVGYASGQAELEQQLGQAAARQMWDMFTAVGYGQALPRSFFPGAVAGRLKPYKTWQPVEQATMSYGHGISVSLIQVARSYMIFARNGEIIPLSFQKVTQPPQPQRVITEKTAIQMREMMERVIGPGGTAPYAQVRGYRVAGKTGTAHKVEAGRYVNKYVASFVGLAPASNPRIIIAVMIDEPAGGKHFGGQVAAPVFANVASGTLRSLNVAPDTSVANVILPAAPVAESM